MKIVSIQGGRWSGNGSGRPAWRQERDSAPVPVNPRTGEFENPAAVAAVYESLQRVLAKYLALAKKYLPGFCNGLNPVQSMFYIDEDQDLARALDEDATEHSRLAHP